MIVDPAFPPTSVAFTPPPVYARWWDMTQSCSGITGSLAAVSWLVVPGTSDFQFKGQTVSGYWTAGSNSIVIADSVQLDGSVVRHEMLHALIKGSGHPRSDFLQKCAGVVSCTSQCVSDAGPPPKIDASIPTVSPDSLELSLQFVPDQPRASIDGGIFTLIVSVRNPASHPVTASLLTPSGVVLPPYSFEIKAAFIPGVKTQGQLNLTDASVSTFGPGETKHQYFDFVIGSVVKNRTVTVGVYRITGFYGSHQVTLNPVTIFP